MSLFKKKDSTSCCCNNNNSSDKITYDKNISDCCPEAEKGICCIKALGSGCKSCHMLLENTKEAAISTNLSLQVEYVTDMQKIMEYGVMSMPALVVNEKVASMGKVLKAAEVEKMLQQYI